MNRVLITGASGFVGRHLCGQLVGQCGEVFGAVRRATLAEPLPSGTHVVLCPDLELAEEWTPPLREHRIDTVVHLASRDHFVGDGSHDALEDYRRVNVQGTRRLATDCIRAGVRRLVFLSSIKAVGEGGAVAYHEQSDCRPETPYGVSKHEAEVVLREFAATGKIEVVIVRPPLIFGPGVGKSFLRLLRLAQRGWPLPLGLVRNQRSLVFVGNLVDAIGTCVSHPAAANELFHVAEPEPLSTPALLRQLAFHLHRRSCLLPFPTSALRCAGWLTGKREEVERLLGSLTMSADKIRTVLGWNPPHSMESGLAATCDWFIGWKDKQLHRGVAA